MDATSGLLAGLLHGAAGEVEGARADQRKKEDDELGFRRHMLDTFMAGMMRGEVDPSYMPRVLQEYANASSSKPRPSQGGKAGFKGATQLPPDTLMALINGINGPSGQLGGANGAPSGPGAGAGGGAGAPAGAGTASSALPPSPPGTGAMAESAGGLASLIPQGSPSSGPTSPASTLAGPDGPASLPAPPTQMPGGPASVAPAPAKQPSFLIPPEEQARRKGNAETDVQIGRKAAEYQQDVQILGKEKADLIWGRKQAGGYLFPSMAPKTMWDPVDKKVISYTRDTYTGGMIDAARNPVPDEVLNRLTVLPKDYHVTNAQGGVTQVEYVPGQAPTTSNVGNIGKGFAPMYEFRQEQDGSYRAFNRRTGQAGTNTGVQGQDRAPVMEQVDTAMAAQATLRQVNQEIAQQQKANVSADPAQLREQFAKAAGFPSFAALQQAASQPTRRVKSPVKPDGAKPRYSPNNPFAPKGQ